MVCQKWTSLVIWSLATSFSSAGHAQSTPLCSIQINFFFCEMLTITVCEIQLVLIEFLVIPSWMNFFFMLLLIFHWHWILQLSPNCRAYPLAGMGLGISNVWGGVDQHTWRQQCKQRVYLDGRKTVCMRKRIRTRSAMQEVGWQLGSARSLK